MPSNLQPSLTISKYVALNGVFPSGGGNGAFTLGMIRMFAGSFDPGDDALAQGQLLSISDNSSLFQIYGTTFGGDGLTTFALPNEAGIPSVSLGQGPGLASYARGQTFGSSTLTLSQANLPASSGGTSAAFDNAEPTLTTEYLIRIVGSFTGDPGTVPLAEIVEFGGGFVPGGYAACNGQLLPIAQNMALFALIGTTYGGDGRTTFALPDLRGRVPVGVGNGVALGQMLGSPSTITQAQMPVGYGGTGLAVGNQQPGLGLTYLIATRGDFPPRDGGSAPENRHYLGEIILYAGDASQMTDNGWAVCNGQTLSLMQNTALFSLLGTSYGGDGRVTFALPDLTARTAVGQGTFDGVYQSVGEIHGADTFTIAPADIPPLIINGTAATETFYGGTFADTIHGGGGADTLIGNGGADTLDGGTGNDAMTGGSGNDIYVVDSVGDVITEAAGDSGDEVRTTLASFALGVTAGSANVENLTGTSGAGQILIGNGGANAITGGGGNDTLVGGAGADALVGGGGEDFADYGASTAAVTVNLATNVNTGGEAQGDTLTGVEDLAGSGYGDTLTGDGADNALFGGGGSDIIHGGGGADRIVGAQQALFGEGDQLFGDGGNDTIYGVNGDVIDGGTGTDVLLANSAANFTIDLAASSIEYAVMAAGNDTVNASAQTVRVDVYAGGGSDTVTGSTFNDTLWGEAGDDILSGGGGGDILVGGAGSDRLVGGAGNDALYGGAGDGVQDTFVFSSAGAADADAIYDFVHGVDKIDMSAFATTFAHIGITSLAGAAIVFLDGQHVATVVGAAGTLTASDFIFSSPAPGQPETADPTVPVVSVDPTDHATSGFDDSGTPTRDVVFSDETPGGMGAVHFSDDTAAPIRATALTAPPEPAFVATGVTFSTLDASPFDRHAMPWDGAFAVAVISGEDNGHWMV